MEAISGLINSSHLRDDSRKHTLTPMVTCASALGLRFKDGVILAADTLGSYGSLARYKNCSRILRLNENVALAVSGDYADFQYLKKLLEEKILEENLINDGIALSASHIFSYLGRILYYRRSKFNPLWNSLVIAGRDGDNKPFLGCVDKIGTSWKSESVSTGMGGYLVQPMFREFYERVGIENITEEMALQFIGTCMSVLYYRDARAFDKYEVAICSDKGITVKSGLQVESNWDVASYAGLKDG